MNFTKLLSSPFSIASGVAVGLYLGWYQKGLVPILAPVGGLYLAILKMCILPLVITAVAGALARLLHSSDAGAHLRRIALVFTLGLFSAATIGTLVCLVIQPGHLESSSRSALGSMVQGNEVLVALSEPDRPAKPAPSALESLIRAVPDNIFRAMASGDNLQVLVFAIFFGLAFGTLGVSANNQTLLDTMDSVYRACQRIIRWTTIALPFALCAMIADQSSSLSLAVVLAMAKFCLALLIGCIIVVLISWLIIWKVCNTRWHIAISSLKEPLVIAAGTQNSLACIPSMIDGLENVLKREHHTTELVVPLGITLCRFGPVLHYALGAVFAAQLYDVPIGLHQMLIVVIMSVVASAASTGTNGVLSLSMMNMVFASLGLPFDALLILFVAIDPLAVVLRTVVTVYGNCAAAALIARPARNIDDDAYTPDKLSCHF